MTTLISCLAWPALQQQAVPSNVEHLKPLEFLVGAWTGSGEMPDPQDPTRLVACTDEFVDAWTLDRNFLKSDDAMKVGDTVIWIDFSMTGWDFERQLLVGHTFGLDGGIGVGTQVRSDAKETWMYEGKTTAPSPFREWRVTLKKVDADTVKFLMGSKVADRYVTAMSGTHRRKKP